MKQNTLEYLQNTLNGIDIDQILSYLETRENVCYATYCDIEEYTYYLNNIYSEYGEGAMNVKEWQEYFNKFGIDLFESARSFFIYRGDCNNDEDWDRVRECMSQDFGDKYGEFREGVDTHIDALILIEERNKKINDILI
jgi:hypothetical protein